MQFSNSLEETQKQQTNWSFTTLILKCLVNRVIYSKGNDLY